MAERDKSLDIIGVIVFGLLIFSLLTVGYTIMNTPSRQGVTPDVNWSLNNVNDTYYRIQHNGGEPVAAHDLTVIVSGNERDVTWSSETLREGDGGLIQVSERQAIAMYWTQEGGDRILLASWQTG